ncbi:MAG: tyrosine-type recombinase/integrase [Tannerellaceae bacterium]
MAGVTVEKRGEMWRYRFDSAKQDGKRARISKGGFDTKKEALASGTKAMADYNKVGIIFTPTEISFGDYLNLWMQEYCVPNLKPETIQHYEKKIRIHIRPKLGKYKLKALTPSILQGLITEKFQEGYSRNSLITIKGILSGCLRYAVEPLKFIEYSPMVHVRLPSPRAKPEAPTRTDPHVFIKDEQITEIFSRFPEETTAHIPLQFGYRCGMRIGEAFAVFWSDVDLCARKLKINRQIQWDAKKQSWFFTDPKYESFREIDIDDKLVSLLGRELERQGKAIEFFDTKYVRLYEDESRYINTDGRGVEIRIVTIRQDGSLIAPRIMQHTSSIIHYQMKFREFDFHSLRHTHATMLLDAGAPIKYVQLRLGHKKPDVTIQVYQHATDIVAQNGEAALGRIFAENGTGKRGVG